MTGIHQLILSLFLFSCAGNATRTDVDQPLTSEPDQGKFRMEIRIPDAPKDVAKLLGVYGNQNYVVDSARGNEEGLFLFQADTLLPTGFYYVMLASDNSYFQLLLGDDQEFRLEATKGKYVNSMKVSGCLDNELLYRNLRFESDFNTRLQPVNQQVSALKPGTPEHITAKARQDELIKERKDHIQWFNEKHPDAFFTRYKLSGQNPELTYPKKSSGVLDQESQLFRYRSAFWEMIDFESPTTIRTPVFANKLRKYIKELTPQQADSLIKYADLLIRRTMSNKELFKFTVNWIALEYKKPKTMGTEALYVHLIDTYWTDELAFWSNPKELKGLRQEVQLMRPSLIGKVGQNIKVQNEKGEPLSLYGIGSAIRILFIYSYDCEHCQKETPDMVRVYNQWKDRGVDVLSLCTDTDKVKWLDFVRKNNMVFHNGFDPERTSRYDHKYHIDITPELYVLDINNRIIASNLSPNQLPQFLEAEQRRNPWY